MDDELSKLLSDLLIALRATFDSASHAEEMSWRTYEAMKVLDPRFLQTYEQDNGASYDQLLGYRTKLLERLDALIAKLQ